MWYRAGRVRTLEVIAEGFALRGIDGTVVFVVV